MLDTLWAQIQLITVPEWIGIVSGIVGVYLGIKEKLASWPLFILCYGSYVYLSYLYQLKAFMLMNAVFVVLSFYGWFKWSRPQQVAEPEMAIRHISKPRLAICLGVLTASTLLLGTLLQHLGEAKVPFLDAFATSMGFIAQWMLSRKYIETWFCWIISDLIYIRLLGQEGSLTSVFLFSVFVFLALKGLHDWKQSIHSTKPAT
ncbi:nicotinamide riboside transporter PnuC [Coraliomargarita parva]|uniref:nicotinamide riboside transporter PnuC n=1 Tax=Coraliomargarita parva TaxID=3014050 RepID=UPI0022B5959D|nr:nicotinamide riboside transporter PnuC [Coraliomargarita parva]